MWSIARAVFMESSIGVATELPHAGSTLEHPLVFDRAAREIKDLAAAGIAEIVSEEVKQAYGDSLVARLTFRRLQ